MKKIFTFLLLAISLGKLSSQCTANFTYTLNAAGNVTFSNTSVVTGTNVSYSWDFGDNTAYSNAISPTNSYAGNGIYLVTLYVYDSIPPNSLCYNAITQTIVITNTVCLVSANISTIQSSNGVVLFSDASTGTIINSTTYTLDLGDNSTPNSFGAHTYSASGNYTISLIEFNSPGCSSTYSSVINVIVQPCTLTANFSYSPSGGTVTFTNTSVGTTSSTTYFWNFYNTNASFLQTPPPETFNYNGSYLVSLSVYDSVLFYCSSTITKTIIIANAPCYVNSAFTMAKDSTQVPLVVWNAYPSYPQNVVSAVWNWGDNSSTNALYPSHTYSAAGTYSICLTVSVSCGGVSTTCFNTLIYKGGEANQIATVHVINLTAGLINQTKSVLSEIKIQPNPNNGVFEIDNLNSEYDELLLYNQLGQQVYIKNITEQTKTNMELDLSNGIYYLQLSKGSSIQMKKIIINR